jgi:uncharacterized membrane protein
MKIKRITMTAMFAALICILTYFVKIPTLNGYINIGDCLILLIGVLLPPVYSFFASAIGSALADVFSGYMIYAPITFLIKGSMSVISYFIYNVLKKKSNNFASLLISFIIAELFMVVGYYIFEGFIYGFIASLANILFNLSQGIVSLIIALLLHKIIKNKIK